MGKIIARAERILGAEINCVRIENRKYRYQVSVAFNEDPKLYLFGDPQLMIDIGKALISEGEDLLRILATNTTNEQVEAALDKREAEQEATGR